MQAHGNEADQWSGAAVEAGPTRWSLVLASAAEDSVIAHRAQAKLIEIYQRPMIVYARRCGLSHEDAEDAVQSFFLERFVKGRLLGSAEASKGSFRGLLRRSLDSWIMDLRRRDRAQKRGGSWKRVEGVVAIDVLDRQVAAGLNPDEAFDRAWALHLVQVAIARLRQDSDAAMSLLLQHVEDGAPEDERQSLAASLGVSMNTLAQRLHRIRFQRLPRILREEIWQDCANLEVFRDEWRIFCDLAQFPPTSGI